MVGQKFGTWIENNKKFLTWYLIGVVLLLLTYKITPVVAWIAFTFAALSAIGNDSIQTLGTFLTSNKKVKWWILWIFVSGVFILTTLYGFFIEGDIAFGRLEKIDPVETFTFFQVMAPLVLVFLTRFKVPVSTTFLILSVFATSKTIEKMLLKSFSGYGVALIVGVVIFGLFHFVPYMKKELSKKEEKVWRVFQWITTGFLWSSWLMQDTANIVVFLPRETSWIQLVGVLIIISIVLGLILFRRGGRIQELVTEKKDVTDVRAATLIDLTLTFVLIYFKQINDIPMSTTWVFLGLLAGRELILSHLATPKKADTYQKTFYLVSKDIVLATIGILISIGLVYATRL